MKPTFTCIYCQKSEPHVSPSKAHIFPDAMGGVSFTKDTVCENCNGKINKEFEQSEIDNFAFFQSLWGIKNRRGKFKRVHATVEFEGKRFNISLDGQGLPKTALVKTGKDNSGKKNYNIIGPYSVVEKKKREIEGKNSSIRWVEKENVRPPEMVITMAPDITRMSLRRLAAKVAFERWAQLMGVFTLSGTEYSDIRDFILSGIERHPLCGPSTDPAVVNSLLPFSAGYHAVVIIAHPESRILGSFVTFYSLFYFWVVLSANYQALAPFDNALIEDPQRQEAQEPLLRRHTGSLKVNWRRITEPFLTNPEKVFIASMEYAIKKFMADEKELSKKMKHVLAGPNYPAKTM